MAKFISQSYGELQWQSACQRGGGAILRPPDHLWMSGKPQKRPQQNQLGQTSVLIPAGIVS